MRGRFPNWLALILAVAALLALLLIPSRNDGGDSGATTAPTSTTAVSSSEHAEIARIFAAVEAGEQLPYPQDGEVFENREGQLPAQARGYYHAYTVTTPGSPDRGARRLIIGFGGDDWYTSDHYSSFVRIDPGDYK
jgi:ribonuclease T1